MFIWLSVNSRCGNVAVRFDTDHEIQLLEKFSCVEFSKILFLIFLEAKSTFCHP